ncbi:MAG TPA: FAD-dependent oxidoreductase [Candidatus Dormibacteraeota bacterium]|jgi:fumarate reductase (CoM/CoB) subunit A|nr:FAD-dependent oxidoreductase [Candidatus Dormibacteraeota bacterium]
MRRIETGVLIVGGGLAALCAALEARRAGAEVTIAVKGRLGRSGASAMTSAGYSSVISEADSPALHYEDTIRGGYGLNDERLVRIMTEEAPARLRELVELGAPLQFDEEGQLAIHPSADHTEARTVGTASHMGLDFTQPLARAALAEGCRALERTVVIDVVTIDGEVAGAVAIDLDASELVLVEAGAVVLGTGGAGRLFAVTSNPNDVTGDGYAIALRAGAALRDMEFIQFYPWRCIVPFDRARMPIQPSTFVLGGMLRNAEGERFMQIYDPERGEATSRDLGARGIYDQVRSGHGVDGGVVLDVSQLTLEDWVRSNPRPARHFIDRGLDFQRERMIVSPEAHFFMGGAVIDEQGATEVPGLYAVGETAGGVHGANRLDSNALPETQVFGARSGRAAAGRLARPAAASGATVVRSWEERWGAAAGRDRGEAPRYADLRRELQRVMWENLGIVRDAARLAQGLDRVHALRGEVGELRSAGARELAEQAQLENSLLVAEASMTAASLRTESRGAHYREDFPEREDARWRRVVALRLEGTELRTELRAVMREASRS